MSTVIEYTKMVTKENGPRPAGKPDECFYCHRKIGQEHKEDCVGVRKIVMVKAEVIFPYDVPSHWSPEDVETYLNDSSRCADNVVMDLARYVSSMENTGRCMCGDLKSSFVRDATEKDLDRIDIHKLIGSK